MFQDGGGFLETFKGASQVSKRSSKGVSREFQGSFKDILRKLQGCLKKVSSVVQENFKTKFKGALRIFQLSFVLRFCCCIDLLAATRAEGELVFSLQRIACNG